MFPPFSRIFSSSLLLRDDLVNPRSDTRNAFFESYNLFLPTQVVGSALELFLLISRQLVAWSGHFDRAYEMFLGWTQSIFDGILIHRFAGEDDISHGSHLNPKTLDLLP